MENNGRKIQLLTPENTTDKRLIKSSCSLLSILLLLFFILIFFLFLLIFFRIKNDPPWSWNNEDKSAITTVFDPGLQNIDHGESVSLEINQEELESLFKIDDPGFPIKKANLKIQTDKIIISGKNEDSFLAMSIEVEFSPQAIDENLVFDIGEIKAAGVPAPQKINQTISDGLKTYLIVEIDDANIEEVELNDGSLVLTGRKK